MIKNDDYYKGLDKRTSEYKEWKAKFEAKKELNLGDKVADVTKATGIDKLVKFIAGEDCGCDDRQEWLNKTFNRRKVECLTESEYSYLEGFFSQERTIVLKSQQQALYGIYNRVFNESKKGTGCSSCVKSVINKLKKLYTNY